MFEKVKAGDIQVGDLVARARTHPFHKVTRLVQGPVAVAIYYDAGGKDRPRKSADWWRKLPDDTTRDRLEYLRSQLRAQCISMGELHELQGLAEHIEPGDVELLEAAGVPEFSEDDDRDIGRADDEG